MDERMEAYLHWTMFIHVTENAGAFRCHDSVRKSVCGQTDKQGDCSFSFTFDSVYEYISVTIVAM
jgi:hypothetical protein